ncbi:MAG: hypothetical protein HGA78_11285, partial [Nitrospirales bacterium]|nr:hypothetical protein [Nitrospirales bacterium]
MVDESSLSIAALGLRSSLAKATGIDENQVIIGHPQAAADQQKDAMDKDFLSLFLYRVEYGA